MDSNTHISLKPADIAAQIYKAEVGSYGIDTEIPTIEIHCSGRCQHTTDKEKQLLADNGYVEMFSYLVVGWDMYALRDDLILVRGHAEPVDA